MIKLKNSHAVILTVYVSELPSALNSSLSQATKAKGRVIYDIRKTPGALEELLDSIKTAPASKLRWVDRDVNKDLMEDIKEYNAENPNAKKVTRLDILHSLKPEDYWRTEIGNRGAGKGKEMHVFTNIDIPGFTGEHYTTKLYVKVVNTPETVEVVSMHKQRKI